MAAEGLGTAFLLAAVVGSGIMGERLAGGNVAVALLANAIATGAALLALIMVFAPLSGAHLNPVVTITAAATDLLPWREVVPYVMAQGVGAIAGTSAAHAMFALPILQLSRHPRGGPGQWLAEVIATAGLLMVVRGCRRYSVPETGAAVGAYILAAYWFTSSTSFANPAVTLARSFSDTFAGIRPADAPGFVLAQLAGLAIFVAIVKLTREGSRHD